MAMENNPTRRLTRRQSFIEKKWNSVDYNTSPQGAEQENNESSIVAKKRLCINQTDETSEALTFVSNSSARIRNESSANEEPNQEDPYVQVASGKADYNLNAEENQDRFASQNVDNNLNAYAPINLPFEKSSPGWEAIESSEIFLTMPQQPHFAPLIKLAKSRREGKAIGLMVNFSSVVNKMKKFHISDSKETIQEMMVTLDDLERHGFKLYNLRNMLECFSILKENHERVMSELQTLHELKSLEEIREGSLTKSEISRLQDEKANIEDSLQIAKSSLGCAGRSMGIKGSSGLE